MHFDFMHRVAFQSPDGERKAWDSRRRKKKRTLFLIGLSLENFLC